MRQVINKLITEEDLYAAVDAAYSQGWRRVKLYFLTGLPTETDEDTLGIAELARNVRRDRPAAHEAGVGARCRSAGSCPKPHTPFQWFGQNTRRASCSARSTCCATRPAQGRGVQLKWHDPKATFAEGIASRGDRRIGRGHRATSGAAAARSRSGASTSTSTAGSTRMAAEGLDARLVRHTATAPRTRSCRGTTSRPGCTRTSSGRTGRTPLAEHGLEDCRWTPCYDCGVCTGYGIEHVVASAVAAGGREPGHRPGPRAAAARSRCAARVGPKPARRSAS